MDLAQCALCNPPIVLFISVHRLNQSIEKSHDKFTTTRWFKTVKFYVLTCCLYILPGGLKTSFLRISRARHRVAILVLVLVWSKIERTRRKRNWECLYCCAGTVGCKPSRLLFLFTHPKHKHFRSLFLFVIVFRCFWDNLDSLLCRLHCVCICLIAELGAQNMVLLWSLDWNKHNQPTLWLIQSFGLIWFWVRWAVFRVSIPRRRRSWIRRNKAMIGSTVNRQCLLTFRDCRPVSCRVIYQSS